MSANLKNEVSDSDPGIEWILMRQAQGCTMSQIAMESNVSISVVLYFLRSGKTSAKFQRSICELEGKAAIKRPALRRGRVRFTWRKLASALRWARWMMPLLAMAMRLWSERIGK